MAGALIVTAELGAADHAWLDVQRKTHFPPERNQLVAHLTMFHAIAPSHEQEARGLLKTLARTPAPRATVAGLINLGGGVAYRIDSAGLDQIRAMIAEHFHGSLTAQDSARWRAHVTIQNKVPATQAKALFDSLSCDFRPRPVAIRGLAIQRYLGGPWEALAHYPFS